jgi:hypothetical protein
LVGKPVPFIVRRVPAGPLGGETVIAGVAAAALAGVKTSMRHKRPETTKRETPRAPLLELLRSMAFVGHREMSF